MGKGGIWKLVAVVFIFSGLAAAAMALCGQAVTRQCDKNVYRLVGGMVAEIEEKYPDVGEEEIIRLINSKGLPREDLFARYGIDVDKGSILAANGKLEERRAVMMLLIFLGYAVLVAAAILSYQRRQDCRIGELTRYLEAINRHEYHLDIETNSEDRLSLLQNEIYKTAVTLNEQARRSEEDKAGLKKSLEDISHQLKTPLTSIGITIDNLLADGAMEEQTRKEFLRSIHRKIRNIHFLVQALLKLSKFDANTVVFHRKEYLLKDLAEEAVENVSALCDLKDIAIEEKGEPGIALYCDSKWQTEAITNILKNSIEHSGEHSRVELCYRENEVFVELSIKDYGEGMTREEARHIFERFYRGKDAPADSVGIGMALAKTIVEKDGGRISVKSVEGMGTTFLLRWFRGVTS